MHGQSPSNQVLQSHCVYALPLLPKGLPVHDALLMAFSTAKLPECGVLSTSAGLSGGFEFFLLSSSTVLQKDGKQLPGKKGISLPQDQFLKLEQHAQELTEALKDQNDSFSVALSNK